MAKSEVKRLRSIRQYLLISLSFLLSGGIILLAYRPAEGLAPQYWAIVLLSIGLIAVLVYQIRVTRGEIDRREEGERMIQTLSEENGELERQLKLLKDEKEQGKNDLRDRNQQLSDLLSQLKGDTRAAYLDSYFRLLGTQWELMQGLLFMKHDDGVYRIEARYAYFSSAADLEFRVGETLLGQVVKENNPLFLEGVESESIIVGSGTGSSKPCSLYMLPIIGSEGGESSQGVFELAFVKTLDVDARDMLTRFTDRVVQEIEKRF